MIFWNRNPDRTKSIFASKATGDRGFISGWITVTKSQTPAFIKISQPINLQEEILKQPGTGSQDIAYAIREKLLEIYDHNERIAIGPVIKSKQEMMEQVLYHKNVLNEIERISKEKNIPEKKLRNNAYKYYDEIAADFSILTIKYFAWSLDFVFEKIFDGIHYDIASMAKIREASKKGPLIFIPSHRSHMDYLIVSYILFKNMIAPPHIAAGINLSFLGIGSLFRHSGAFFLRRTFKGLDLYPVVFKQYLKTLVSENYSIEFFIEGSRTRTGRLGFPKLGVLRYLVEAVEENYSKDLIFIPVTVNYERIMEENAYQKELQGAEKETESLSAVVKARKFLKKKYGKVYLVFDEAVSFNELKSSIIDKKETVNAIAENIINKINEITVVTSTSLASTTMLLLSDKGFSKNMIIEGFKYIYNYLLFCKVNMSDTLRDAEDLNIIVDEIIGSFLNDNIIHELTINDKDERVVVEDLYLLREDNRIKIRFYKNTIMQYLLPISFVSLSIVKEMKTGRIEKEKIEENYVFLKDLFSEEFIYSDEIKHTNNKCKTAYNFLVNQSIISENGNEVTVNKDSINVIQLYSRILKGYIESYYIALQVLTDENNKKIQSDKMLMEIKKRGIKSYHLGEIELIESLSTPSYQNALKKYSKLGITRETQIQEKLFETEVTDREKAIVLYDKIISFK
jgi:glycerol-3-phosphate O-acyltransferase